MPQFEASLTDDAISIIYNHMFKIQAPDRRAWQTETDAQADRREQKKTDWATAVSFFFSPKSQVFEGRGNNFFEKVTEIFSVSSRVEKKAEQSFQPEAAVSAFSS
jgi:hypothetical protein